MPYLGIAFQYMTHMDPADLREIQVRLRAGEDWKVWQKPRIQVRSALSTPPGSSRAPGHIVTPP